jgi:hypothetical protein
MWACAQYAVPDDYLRSAAKEVKDQVRRLQHRPSIVLWAGNNENERDLANNTEYLVKPYADLYFRTVLANVTALDSSRPTSGSSPSCGNETAADPFCPDHQTEYYGDVHCYLYDVDNWDVTAYKRPRFMSEFGLQVLQLYCSTVLLLYFHTVLLLYFYCTSTVLRLYCTSTVLPYCTSTLWFHTVLRLYCTSTVALLYSTVPHSIVCGL